MEGGGGHGRVKQAVCYSCCSLFACENRVTQCIHRSAWRDRNLTRTHAATLVPLRANTRAQQVPTSFHNFNICVLPVTTEVDGPRPLDLGAVRNMEELVTPGTKFLCPGSSNNKAPQHKNENKPFTVVIGSVSSSRQTVKNVSFRMSTDRSSSSS